MVKALKPNLLFVISIISIVYWLKLVLSNKIKDVGHTKVKVYVHASSILRKNY